MRAHALIPVLGLYAVAAQAGSAEWLFGGHWVELDQACEVRLPDGRERPAGMRFEEGKAVFNPPAGVPDEGPVSLAARYTVSGESVLVRTQAPNGATTELLLQRAGPGQIRDAAGYVYRRCNGMIS